MALTLGKEEMKMKKLRARYCVMALTLSIPKIYPILNTIILNHNYKTDQQL